MNYKYIALVFLLLFSCGLSSWWNSSFERRVPITFSATGTAELNLSYYENMKADFSDVVFIKDADNTPMSFWVEYWKNSSFAHVWVNVTDTTAYMYYNSTDATSRSSLIGVSLFGDQPVSTDINTTLWTSTSSANDFKVNTTLFNRYVIQQKTQSTDRYLIGGTNITASGAIKYVYFVRQTGDGHTVYHDFFNMQTSSFANTQRNEIFYCTSDKFLRLYKDNTGTLLCQHTWADHLNGTKYWIRLSIFENATNITLFGQNFSADGSAMWGNAQEGVTSNCSSTSTTYRNGFNGLKYGAYSASLGYYAGLATFSVPQTPITAINGFVETQTGDTITISNPVEGTTALSNYANLNFTIGFTQASYNASIYVDGTFNITANITNSTYSNFTFPLSDGAHTIYIQLTDNASVNKSVTFTLKEYALNSTTDLTDVLATQQLYYYAYLGNYSNSLNPSTNIQVTFNLNGTMYNATYNSTTGTLLTYYALLTMPNVNASIQLNTTAYFNFTGGLRSESTNDTLTVNKIYINNCTAPASMPTATFVAYDEITGTPLTNMNYDLIVTYWIGTSMFNYSFTYTNVTTATLCIYPNYSTIYANVDVAIYNASERYRTNYLVNASLTNVSQQVTTYTFVNSSGSIVTFSLIDQYGNPVSNNYIKVQRYFTANTSWLDVTTLRTNGVGGASTYLIPYDVAYKFLIYNNNTLVRTYDPIYITQGAYQFTTASTTAIDYKYYMNIGVACSWNNATKIFSCTATDPSGLMANARLLVRETRMFGATDLCNSNASGSAVTIICDLNAHSNTTDGFSYAFYTTINSREYLRQSGYFNAPTLSTANYGTSGLIYTAIIVILLFFAGIWSVSLAVVLAYAGLVLSTLIGFIALSVPTLIGLGAVVIIIAYKLRS